MITIAITYRNRDLNIVKRCLDSLANQTDDNFIVDIVDYGSDNGYSSDLKELIKNYTFIQLISVSTKGQLWNKSRAINIVLKKCTTQFFIMGDIDLLYHPNFIKKSKELILTYDVAYFQYGYLSEVETNKNKLFEDNKINFLGTSEGTGTNIYKTKVLKEINGYDEFYHGWGAEDTDVHYRLKNAGYFVHFYDEEILVKHMYHKKTYRTKKSKEPFHSSLEKINNQYMLLQSKLNITKANLNFKWGILPKKESFKENTVEILLSNKASEIEALLIGVLENIKGKKLILSIVSHKEYKSSKNYLKKVFGKKYLVFYDFQTINNLILETIITRFKNNYYEYNWDKASGIINLKIAL